MELTGTEARAFWKALIDNASALIVDAKTLLEVHSNGRASSLTVLAQEELGKALWLYEAFESAWNSGDDSPRRVEALTKHGFDHVKKYVEAVRFGEGLAFFWGDVEAMNRLRPEDEADSAVTAPRSKLAERAARAANLALS